MGQGGMAEIARLGSWPEAEACIDEAGMLALEAREGRRSDRAEGWPSG
jgi:hypothetical protein